MNPQAGYQLKNWIYEKYKNEATMAMHMSWPRQRLNKITTCKREPTVQEVGQLAEALNKPLGEVASIFLPSKSPNG